ncbi:MAG: TMEM175 family protein [Methanobrevibacter sp.]|jgi:uncharacterized membrane protein|nr:TMEM175 family protein [Methanobrevibacter sp.]
MKYSKERFDFFTDGVMAIIITIMVLEIPLSNSLEITDLFDLLNCIFVFFASFIIVGSFWTKHNFLFNHLETLSDRIIWRNFMFLFFLALLPIFTKWVLENPDQLIPAFSYSILYILVNVTYILMFSSVIKTDEFKSSLQSIDAEGRDRRHRRDKNENSVIHLISIAIVIAGVVILGFMFPEIAIVLFILIPILFSLQNVFIDGKERGISKFFNKIFQTKENKKERKE